MGLKSSDLIPGTLQKRFVFCRMPACYMASCVTPVLQNFDTLISEVRDPLLHEFVRNAMYVREIHQRFLMAPASIDNHHAYPGGLAMHSLEVVELFLEQAHWPLPLTQTACELGIVCALFHDVGKVATDLRDFDPSERRWAHERRGIQLLQKPLQRLSQKNPELARALRYHLVDHRTCKGASGRLLQTLRYADQASACINNELCAVNFGRQQDDHWILPGSGPSRRYYASMALEPKP